MMIAAANGIIGDRRFRAVPSVVVPPVPHCGAGGSSLGSELINLLIDGLEVSRLEVAVGALRLLAGLAYYSLERYEDAAKILEGLEPYSKSSSSTFWANYQGRWLLMATYGQLGRIDKAAGVEKEVKFIWRILATAR
jgi:hypothetical protein